MSTVLSGLLGFLVLVFCPCKLQEGVIVFLLFLPRFHLISAIFVFTTKTTQPRTQLFSVNGALTCKKAAFFMSSVD